ncbi:Hpt domain-containing protein [Agarivorans sp. 3_MG-2023]|nr:Hpt domain-containing protein [Agarivorans sp. 3_MG-2023]MDO6684298.1 Hpt domain-containing protein [Agarivorans sp. 3_MG-2023]
MQRANNNQTLALDMFVMLQESFAEIESGIEQVLAQQLNADEFVLLIHRFRGGCAYSGCKRLESLAGTIEDSLRQHGEVARVEPELLELSDEIEKVKLAAKQINQQLS